MHRGADVDKDVTVAIISGAVSIVTSFGALILGHHLGKKANKEKAPGISLTPEELIALLEAREEKHHLHHRRDNRPSHQLNRNLRASEASPHFPAGCLPIMLVASAGIRLLEAVTSWSKPAFFALLHALALVAGFLANKVPTAGVVAFLLLAGVAAATLDRGHRGVLALKALALCASGVLGYFLTGLF
jgi:hypothetical protein